MIYSYTCANFLFKVNYLNVKNLIKSMNCCMSYPNGGFSHELFCAFVPDGGHCDDVINVVIVDISRPILQRA